MHLVKVHMSEINEMYDLDNMYYNFLASGEVWLLVSIVLFLTSKSFWFIF